MLMRKDVGLRPIIEADLEQVLHWRNSERIRCNMYTDHIISMEEHRAWFQSLKKGLSDVYLIFELCNKAVGVTYFTNINQKNGTGYWGFYLGEENLPHGSGSILGFLGLEYAFEELRIRKLCGEAFLFNSASTRFFLRFGFVEEGHFVKHVLKNNDYEDIVSFALFSNEWQTSKAELLTRAFGEGGGMS